jgi:hypothetical protein
MGNYKALLVGEQKVKSTEWRDRDHAAMCIIRDGLSVQSVYERKGSTPHFFDVSDKIAAIIKSKHSANSLPDNIKAFLIRAAK